MPQVHAPGVGGGGRLGRGAGRAGAGARTKVHLFVMRASFSGAAFCQASLVETQQAFLELHVEAFEWFGGVFDADPLRQPELGGQAGPEGPPAGRDRPVRRAALALPVRVAVHDAGPRRARTRRAASRARSAASAATISSRSRRSRTWPSSTRCCSPAARRTCAGGSSGAPRRSARRGQRERPLLRALPGERVRRDRDGGAARRCEVAGHGPPEPLLGPGRPGRAAGRRARIGAREITISHAGRGGRPSRAAARPLRHQRAARPLPRAARSASPAALERSLALAQERERGAWPGALRRAVGGARPSRYGPLGGRPADGRRPDALPRARARRASRWPSAARSRPARTTAAPSRSSPAAPRRRRAAPAPLSDLEPRLAAHARPAPDLADYDQLLGGTR